MKANGVVKKTIQLLSAGETVEGHTHSNKSILDNITNNKVNNWDSAYEHSQSSHAPANAQKNSDITKSEIEAKLVGEISSHTHGYAESDHNHDAVYSKLGHKHSKTDIVNMPTKLSEFQNDIGMGNGVTPNITIGTVTTLEAGQQATVVNSGTKENPIFDFGIPQGQRGNDGADGITPDMTEFKNQINGKYDTIEKKVDDHINNHPNGGGSCDYKKIVDFTDFKNKQFYPTAYDSTTGIFTCANHGITKYTGIIFKLKNNYKQMTELATLSSLLNGKANLQILSVDANSFKIRYGYNDSNIVTGDLGIDINELFLEDFTSIASYSFEALGKNITHLKGILNCGIPSTNPNITNDTLKSTVGANNGFSNFAAGLYPSGMPAQKPIDGYCDLEFDFKLSNDKKTMYCSHTLSFYYIENGTVKKGRNENFAIIHPSKDKPLFSLDNITFNMSFCNGSRIRLYEIGGE